MICIENGYRITKYFLFNALILFPLCFAQDEIELRLENHDWKPPRRHLLWRSSSSSMTGPELAVYIIAVVIITFISICCKYCIREGCEPTDNYRDAVVHPPPRNPTVPIAPSSGRRLLNPPRSSGSIILPPEDGVFAVDLTGIENPNYNPSIHLAVPSYHPSTAPQFSMNEPNNENPTPILDLPPSYESVVKTQNSEFSKVFDKSPK
ncbi:uncharacterized protein LOC129960606 isoform X2 [Argiope bruennichi]|uniref:uncharacterized protein LOC129960606 isoform X2 n=1 Tax=Argiope bruennichi TaxID=94029 RepID=UPI002494A5B3|nr:uncharacterized protein LOC129960606 isoform X2 [Argiope bruennichi]